MKLFIISLFIMLLISCTGHYRVDPKLEGSRDWYEKIEKGSREGETTIQSVGGEIKAKDLNFSDTHLRYHTESNIDSVEIDQLLKIETNFGSNIIPGIIVGVISFFNTGKLFDSTGSKIIATAVTVIGSITVGAMIDDKDIYSFENDGIDEKIFVGFEDLGKDDNSLLSDKEAVFLNSYISRFIPSTNFDLKGKRALFVTGSSGQKIGSKKEYFKNVNNYKTRYNGKIATSVIILDDEQIDQYGVDVVITYWVKVLSPDLEDLLESSKRSQR